MHCGVDGSASVIQTVQLRDLPIVGVSSPPFPADPLRRNPSTYDGNPSLDLTHLSQKKVARRHSRQG